MDLLKEELERKRKAKELLKESIENDGKQARKYIKQKDIQEYEEKKRIEAIRAYQEHQKHNIIEPYIPGNHTSEKMTENDVKTIENDDNNLNIAINDDKNEEIEGNPMDIFKDNYNQKIAKTMVDRNQEENTDLPLYLRENLTKEEKVYKYFKGLLKKWEMELNARSDKEKAIQKGKLETKSFNLCKEHIKLLFKLCKAKEVPHDVLDKLLDIVRYCEIKNFREANDQYIRVAIGNAAWPIGLTMVGIHERSGRERISTANIAHAMNNEAQRKYLTACKRLISYAQDIAKDVLPSMKVL